MNGRTWTSILAYTSARILMFGCAVILLYVAGARGILLLALGFFISMIASYILLNRQRALIADKLNGRLSKAGSKVTAKATELRERLDEGTAAEDSEAEDSAAEDSRAEETAAAAPVAEDGAAADTADAEETVG